MLTMARLLESFEAGLCYDIYFDRIAQSLIQLPGAIKNGKIGILKIVLVLAIKNVASRGNSDAVG